MSKKTAITGPVKAPLGSYPKLWRLLDHYFLKEEILDRANVEALDTIVDLNAAILNNPKSVNNRSIRSSEPRIRNLVDMGGTDILTEVGWRFKILQMQECWVLPYDADLTLLQESQDKIIETQEKLQARFAKQIEAVSNKSKKDQAEKLAIIKQIEHDRAEREYRKTVRSGAPPKQTQSLDEIRKQAVKERLEREKAKAQKSPPVPQSSSPTIIPGAFPQSSRIAESDSESLDSMESAEDLPDLMKSRPGGPTGGRSTRMTGTARKPKVRAPVPIDVKKKTSSSIGYAAGEHRLGGPDDTTGSIEPMDADEFRDDDDNDDD